VLPGHGSDRGFNHLHYSLNHLRSEPLNPVFAVCRFHLGTEFQNFWEWDTFDINSRNTDGETLLYVASFVGNERIVKSLLENGADINIPSKNFWSRMHAPLMAAITHKQARMAVMLLDYCAVINFHGYSPIKIL
jgi:ankyrin repeat protein